MSAAATSSREGVLASGGDRQPVAIFPALVTGVPSFVVTRQREREPVVVWLPIWPGEETTQASPGRLAVGTLSVR
jgi:hypothetical protein